jgi:hypothetical protein
MAMKSAESAGAGLHGEHSEDQITGDESPFTRSCKYPTEPTRCSAPTNDLILLEREMVCTRS